MPDNGNEYTYEYLPVVRLVGGCNPSAVTYSSYANRQMFRLYYSWNNPDHRVKPDPWLLNKSITPLPAQQRIEVQTGRSGWYRTGVQNDYTCSPYKQKQYQKCFFVWPGPSSTISWAAWPDWSLPLRLAIKGDVINLGATLAEYRQSVQMFGSAVVGVRDAFRAIRKLKFMKNRSLCSVTNAHLIHDYGIAPLMSDMFDSVETLRLRLEQPIYKRYHFRQPLTVMKEQRTLTTSDGSGSYTDFSTYYTGSQEVVAHVELDREKASRFTLGNPLELLWEVTPLSFVADWFIPIGDWLIALDAMKAVKEVNVSITRKRKCYTAGTIHAYDKPTYGGTYRPQLIEPWYKQTIHERVVSNSVPLPPLPRPKLSGSISRLLNAVSLLVSMRGCKGVMPRFSVKDFYGLAGRYE